MSFRPIPQRQFLHWCFLSLANEFVSLTSIRLFCFFSILFWSVLVCGWACSCLFMCRNEGILYHSSHRRSDGDLGCWPSPSTFFEAQSHVYHCIHQASWSSGLQLSFSCEPWDHRCVTTSSIPWALGIQTRACMTVPLPTESPLQARMAFQNTQMMSYNCVSFPGQERSNVYNDPQLWCWQMSPEATAMALSDTSHFRVPVLLILKRRLMIPRQYAKTKPKHVSDVLQ